MSNSIFNKVAKFAKKGQVNLTKKRDIRCIPLSVKVMDIINQRVKEMAEKDETDKIMGTYVEKKTKRDVYHELASDILKELLEDEAHIGEVEFIFQVIGQVYENTQKIISRTINSHLETANTQFWGKGADDVTFRDLENILKEKPKK